MHYNSNMLDHIKTKLKDCESFAKECEKWKKNCERQLGHINHVMKQNDNMLKTCKDIVDYEETSIKSKTMKASRRLDFSVSTPPTPMQSINLSESQVTINKFSLSPSLVLQNNNDDDDDDDDILVDKHEKKDDDNEYKTPLKKTKHVSFREDENTTKKSEYDAYNDNDNNSMELSGNALIDKLLDTHEEEFQPKIKRKRQRIKK